MPLVQQTMLAATSKAASEAATIRVDKRSRRRGRSSGPGKLDIGGGTLGDLVDKRLG